MVRRDPMSIREEASRICAEHKCGFTVVDVVDTGRGIIVTIVQADGLSASDEQVRQLAGLLQAIEGVDRVLLQVASRERPDV